LAKQFSRGERRVLEDVVAAAASDGDAGDERGPSTVITYGFNNTLRTSGV
jgi:hypothetical protein